MAQTALESMFRAYAGEHPSDAARALEALPPKQAARLIQRLPDQLVGRVLEHLTQAVLAHQAPYLVDLGRTLTDQRFTNAVRGLAVLLRDALDRYEAHTGSAHRLANRLRVYAIVLVALDGRLHELSRDEPDLEFSSLNLTSPVMGRCASLHPDLRARGQAIAQSLEPSVTPELRLPPRLVMTIDRVKVKDGFCNVDPSSRKLRHGLLLIL